MRLFENIMLAFGTIKTNKLRSFLTMLGIIIGVSSVIMITTIGNSVSMTVENEFNNSGMNNIWVNINYDQYYSDDGNRSDYSELPSFTKESIIQFENESEGKYAIYFENSEIDAMSNDKYGVSHKQMLAGYSTGSVKTNPIKILYGRGFDSNDQLNSRKIAIVSDKFVKITFPKGTDPLGQKIKLESEFFGEEDFVIVGVYEEKTSKPNAMGMDYYDEEIESEEEKANKTTIYTPAFTIEKMFEEKYEGYGIHYLSVLYDLSIPRDQAIAEIEEFFNGPLGDKAYVECYDESETLSEIKTGLMAVSLVFSAIAAISLLVGGIGVMNIMLVSVAERTREIGVEKALGAKNRDIKAQFITESVVLSVLGGIIGVLLGVLLGVLICNAGKGFLMSEGLFEDDSSRFIIQPSYLAISLSVAFSAVIGLIFGTYPAKKAAKLNPVDALRYE